MTTAHEGTVAVLEWRAWDRFLLNYVLRDEAVRIEVDPFRELPPEEFDRLCDSFKTVCFQINLSVRSRLPLQIRDLTNRFKERGIHVVNGLVQDIRKSTLHAHLESIGLNSPEAAATGASDEMLFVKTSLNYGGDLERWLSPESIAAGGFERLVSPDIRGAYYYRTVGRGMLEAETWNDPAIVVEKYISNSENSFYRVYFSGQQVIFVKAYCPGEIKKISNDPRDTNYVTDLEHLKAGTDRLEDLSPTLKRDAATFIDKSPVDFGCIDIVHDGNDNHYIIDLNLTPYAGKNAPELFLIDFLRQGITGPTQRKVTGGINSPLAAF